MLCPNNLQRRSLQCQWIKGWAGPRADLDAVEKRKSLAHAGKQIEIPWSSSLKPITVPAEISQLATATVAAESFDSASSYNETPV
jgi:hypothetical protein